MLLRTQKKQLRPRISSSLSSSSSRSTFKFKFLPLPSRSSSLFSFSFSFSHYLIVGVLLVGTFYDFVLFSNAAPGPPDPALPYDLDSYLDSYSYSYEFGIASSTSGIVSTSTSTFALVSTSALASTSTMTSTLASTSTLTLRSRSMSRSRSKSVSRSVSTSMSMSMEQEPGFSEVLSKVVAITSVTPTSTPTTTVAATTVESPFVYVRCGVPMFTSDELVKIEKDFESKKIKWDEKNANSNSSNGSREGGGGNSTESEGVLRVGVHVHVVAKNRKLDGGYVPNLQIAAQMDVLNTDFQNMNVQFELVNVGRSVNKTWFEAKPNTQELREMKRALRKGGPGDLNIYLNCIGCATGILGYSTFPSAFAKNPDDDGVVVLYSSLPGGSMAPYNRGRTLTHEVGHWLGLYHTFQGGCLEPGDFVDDTPPEAVPGFGCPEGRRTCLATREVDPIHNFMDYGDDDCLQSFTPGQISRVKTQVAIYRNITITGVKIADDPSPSRPHK